MLFLLLFNLLLGGCHANPDAKRLYDDLLSNYNRLVRPVSNHTEQINVINVSRIDVVNVINIIGFIKVIISISAMAQSLILREKCKEKRIVPGQWQ